MLDLQEQSLFVLIAMFVGAGAVVWTAGSRLSRYAAAVSQRTGIEQAAVGMVMLAGITSLPELAVSLSAAQLSGPDLAVNNLLGSIALQAALLAMADMLIGRGALTAILANPAVMLLGALNIMLLAVVAAGALVPSPTFVGIGYWCWGLVLLYPLGIVLVHQQAKGASWKPVRSSPTRNAGADDDAQFEGVGTVMLAIRIVAAAAAILAAGLVLAQSGDAIAQQTGVGASFFGVVFLAIATSLPEISTVSTSARAGRYELAVSDILGTNLFNLLLVVAVDASLPGQAVLNTTGTFAAFGALLGLLITAIFLAGLIERRDRAVLRMGYDSIAVLIVYVGGLTILYHLRP